MTQLGFEEYLIAVYGNGTGTTKSYVKAIRIIDEMFLYEDVFGLSGKSIATIDDFAMLNRIADFVCAQQTLFQKGNDSIFRNIKPNQSSYPGKGYCSAAIKQLLKYYAHNLEEEKAQSIFKKKSQGKQVSKQLLTSLHSPLLYGECIFLSNQVRPGSLLSPSSVLMSRCAGWGCNLFL